MFAQVLLLSPPFGLLDYALPDYFPHDVWKPGLRVIVPLGNSLRVGLVQGLKTSAQETGGFGPSDLAAVQTAQAALATRQEQDKQYQDRQFKLKPIIWPLEHECLFAPSYLSFLQELANHLLSAPGQILSRVLPKALRSLSSCFFYTRSAHLGACDLARMDNAGLRCLAQAWMGKKMYPRRVTAQETWYAVVKSPPWAVRPGAKRQLQILEYLWEEGPRTRGQLVRCLGGWVHPVLKTLEKKGLLAVRLEENVQMVRGEGRGLGDLLPTQDQLRAIQYLREKLQDREAEVGLLHGVTGSGKTLVYLELIRYCLEQGRSALFLLPELALLGDVWNEAVKRLSVPCFLYHGYQSPGQRTRIFEQVARLSEPCLLIGTRSACFVPRSDWGLIVLDEEHDESFKQDENLVYHVREVAYLLARQHKSLLLLGSATPDLKTYFAAQKKTIFLQEMPSRVGKRTLPAIKVIDVLQDREKGEGPFSNAALAALDSCLNQGEQAIVLLNRRGYAPLVYCVACGQVVRCEQCQVGLTYHKDRQRLLCHYCGQSKGFPLACPQCGGHEYLPINHGTEQIEEILQGIVGPDKGLLRLDRDTTRRQGSLESIISRFSRGEAQVLVGTQMCSKGHNFPGVTLVIVLDGDLSLNLPDYRATERTFQLLLQVSGRAGRGERPGQVIIQTRNPDHFCWQYLQKNDFHGFVAQELSRRKRLHYPPFMKLALLRMSFPVDWDKGQELVRGVGKCLGSKARAFDVQVLGPAPAPLSRLRNRLRYQCLLKSPSWSGIRALCKPLLHSRQDRRFRISLDLDPLQLL